MLLSANASKNVVKVLAYKYLHQRLSIRWDGVLFEEFLCSNGVRQGSSLSPFLFNFYIKHIFQAYILPHVLFRLPVWGTLNISQCHLLDNCLLRCAKLIMRNPKASFNKDTYNFTGILPFQSYVL